MEFFSRLTPFEERVWELFEGAFALGERISHQVSRAAGDAAVGACEAIFPSICESAPLSQSSPPSTSQDVEALASSALSQEQHTCEVTSEAQGPDQTQDIPSDLVPEFSSLAFDLPCCAPQSPALYSSQDGDSASARSPPLLTHTSSSGEASQTQGPEQTHDASDESVPALDKGELLCSQLLASAELCERGLCGAIEGALPAGGERISEGEEGAGSARSQRVVLAEPSGGACHFERLDRGCVYEILQTLTNTHLKDCSLVCREWLEVSNEVRYTMTLEKAPQTPALPVLLRRFSHLRVIQIWDEAAEACPDAAFVNHLAWQTQLEKLDVKGCGGLSDAGLAAVLRGCPGLRSLVLRQRANISGAGFEGVQCKLEVLELDSCDAVTDDGVRAVSGACSGLVRLVIRMGSEDGDLLAAGLEQIAKRCSGLRELILHASWVTDNTLQAFAAGCPGLSWVELSCERGIGDDGVSALSSRCRQLRTLGLVNNPYLYDIPRSGPGLQLKALSLGWFAETMDSMLRRISEEVNLEELIIMSCPALTDATIEKILQGCVHLKRLGLCYNERLTPGILGAHAKYGSKALLEVRDCKGIDPSAVLQQMPVLLNVQLR